MKQCLIDRISLYRDISMCSPEKRDIFLEDISALNHEDVRSAKKAKILFFKNEVCATLCDKLKSSGVNIMIGGSTALAACYKHLNIIPNDIDMYVKSLCINDIIKVEQCIREIFPECDLIVIRNVITLTWIVYKKKKIVYEFQLSILQIDSWTDVLISTHSDIVALCYDVLEEKFLFLKNRWTSILDRDKIHYFSDILTCDTGKSLHKATEKYIKRGFNCASIFMGDDNIIVKKINNKISGDGKVLGVKLFKFLKKKYIGISNIQFGLFAKDLIVDLHPNKTDINCCVKSFKMLDLWNLHNAENKGFTEAPSQLQLFYGEECPIEIENHVVLVKNKNCSHSISLRAYLGGNLQIDRCPLCRKKFLPKLIVVQEVDIN